MGYYGCARAMIFDKYKTFSTDYQCVDNCKFNAIITYKLKTIIKIFDLDIYFVAIYYIILYSFNNEILSLTSQLKILLQVYLET